MSEVRSLVLSERFTQLKLLALGTKSFQLRRSQFAFREATHVFSVDFEMNLDPEGLLKLVALFLRGC